jgi:hypothetical protein
VPRSPEKGAEKRLGKPCPTDALAWTKGEEGDYNIKQKKNSSKEV